MLSRIINASNRFITRNKQKNTKIGRKVKIGRKTKIGRKNTGSQTESLINQKKGPTPINIDCYKDIYQIKTIYPH